MASACWRLRVNRTTHAVVSPGGGRLIVYTSKLLIGRRTQPALGGATSHVMTGAHCWIAINTEMKLNPTD